MHEPAGTFYFDDTCKFCVRSAELLKHLGADSLELKPLEPSLPSPSSLPSQSSPNPSEPTPSEPTSNSLQAPKSGEFESAKFQNAEGEKYGHLAIAEALKTSPYRYARLLSAGIESKWISPIAKQAYKLVARFRHFVKVS